VPVIPGAAAYAVAVSNSATTGARSSNVIEIVFFIFVTLIFVASLPRA
jgi:hypothetical protein